MGVTPVGQGGPAAQQANDTEHTRIGKHSPVRPARRRPVAPLSGGERAVRPGPPPRPAGPSGAVPRARRVR